MDNKYVEMKFLRKQNGRILKHKKKKTMFTTIILKFTLKLLSVILKKRKKKKLFL